MGEQKKFCDGRDPEWVFLAPGRGKLKELMSQVGAAPCHIYSGAFNTRLPQMTKSDIDAITRVAQPMHDSAHFIFTKQHDKDYKGMESLRGLWPDLGKDIATWNRGFAEAWRQFSQEFDASLINPGRPNLFKRDDPLTDEENKYFTEKIKPLYGDPSQAGALTQPYARAIVEAPFFEKVTD